MYQRARGFFVSEGQLYKSGVTTPWLKCIPIAHSKELLNEIHSGLCSSHIGVRPLAAKAFRQGFLWPLTLKDAEHIVKHMRSLPNDEAKIQLAVTAFAAHNSGMASPKVGHGPC
jgi:hypothetical protein